MSKECTTHHHACDCREEKFKQLEKENAALNHKLDEILTNKNYEGGVQFWINKHDEVLLREASLRAENSALRADKERLDWMEKARPIAWALGSVNCGEYWLLTDIGEKHPEEAEEFATLRAAIDAARKEAQP